MPAIDSGDTAWVLASAAMVLLMTPGLAFFYGGMTRMKTVLNMIMMSFGALAIVGVLWILYGYSEAFGNSVGGHGLVGNIAEFAGMKGLLGGPTSVAGITVGFDPSGVAVTHYIPQLAFVAFQCMFACITVALISGAVADRIKFGSWLVFAGIWATLVYFPVAHWVFAFNGVTGPENIGGWIANKLKAIDFAGGTAVHINAGAAGLALALIVGKRVGWPNTPMKPHNLPLVMIGAGLLWFGWFGFNAGSALAANQWSATVFVNTFVATCAAALGWLFVERMRDGHATSLGMASGVVAGLVAITPSCSAVNPLGAIAIGVIAGATCALAVGLKYRFGFDESLDVVGVHLVGGIVGTILIGIFATSTAPGGVQGLLYGGGLNQLWRQLVGAGVVLTYSFTLTYLIGLILHKTIGLRIDHDDEIAGIDVTSHAESAYEFDTKSGSFVGVGRSSLVGSSEAKS